MPKNLDIGIALSWSPFLFFLFVLIVTGFTFWVYRFTVPPVSRSLRLVLISLRSLALILALFTIFEPILHLYTKKTKNATVGLLIDTSGSMQIEDNGRARKEILDEILCSPALQNLEEKFTLRPTLFSDRLVQLREGIPDSLVFKGTATDIAEALLSLQEQKEEIYLSGALLLSDGGHNRGENPVRIGKILDYPVYTIFIGGAQQKPDLLITKILSNEITYVGNKVPVEISVRGPGFAGKRVSVRIRKGEEVLDQKTISVPLDGLETSFELYFTPQQPGFQKITAEISRLEGELTFENNLQEVYVKVLKSKLKVLLLADGPSPDLAFLKRILSDDENLQLLARTQRSGNTFYEGLFPSESEIETLDILVLMDVPSPRTSRSAWKRVTKILLQDKKPFFFIGGKQLDPQKLKTIQALVPFKAFRRRSETSVLPRLTSEGEIHPVLRIYENSIENLKAWDQLPPIFSSWTSAEPKPECDLLATGIPERLVLTSKLKGSALIISRHIGEEKSIAILGHGLYRWDLLMWGIGGTNDVLKDFVGNSIRWLVTREEDKPVRVSTNKRIYGSGEEVFLSAQVYDEISRPVPKASVRIKLISPSGESTFQLADAGAGRYKRTFRAFEQGTYRVEGEAWFHDRSLGRDETEFSVSSFNPEFLDTKADHELLKNLAQITGGKSGPPDSLSSIVSSINFPTREIFTTKEIEIYNLIWTLVLIILLLSVEWFIRKRKGMV